MKKQYFIYFSLAILMMLAITACSNKVVESSEISVYSFSGENDDISLINGVALIGTEKEILSGGELKLKSDKFKNIKYYKVRIYINTKKSSLMSNAEEIKNGSFSKEDMEGDVGSISPFMDNHTTLEEFKNNLYFTLETVDNNDKKSEYNIHLKVKEITNN